MDEKLPEQIIYRRISKPKVTCPNNPKKTSYAVNKPVPMDECKKCPHYRGDDGSKVACAWDRNAIGTKKQK